jgi:hypothetical protein
MASREVPEDWKATCILDLFTMHDLVGSDYNLAFAERGAFLASNLSAYMTNATFDINGGLQIQ